jgi:putative transposase
MMLRSYQLRLRPNRVQVAAFEEILRDSCETYNAALQERKEAWKLERKNVTFYDQCAELTELRKDPRFAMIAVDIQREPLRRVDRAFRAFFRRCKVGERPGYPRFRPRDRYDSFAFGNGDQLVIRDRSVKIPKVGDVRAKECRPLVGTPKQCTVKREGKKWIAMVMCDIGPAPEKRAVSRAVGIDVGLAHFVTLSDGATVVNPRWTKRHEMRIARANLKLARKKRGSKNRPKAKEALRRAHQRAAGARRNFTHHVSKWLVGNYDLIAFEKLNIGGMAQSRLGKSILDAGWAELIWQISYKAESAGRWAIPVNPRGTSICCSGCGEPVPKTLADRQHICGACGLSLDRDHNAALNIKRLGMSLAGLAPSESMQAG